MPSLPVYDLAKKKVDTAELSDSVFAGEIKPHLVNETVRGQIAARYEYRTANSYTRTEVQGTRKKIYKQKGTGQARHGDAKAPIFVGGGKAHGPKPRRVRFKVNKKVARAAAISALSFRQKQDQLFVIQDLSLEKINTKAVSQFLKEFNLKKALIVNMNEEKGEKAFNQSCRNIPGIKCIRPEGINVFDLLKYQNLFLAKKTIQKVTERFSHV